MVYVLGQEAFSSPENTLLPPPPKKKQGHWHVARVECQSELENVLIVLIQGLFSGFFPLFLPYRGYIHSHNRAELKTDKPAPHLLDRDLGSKNASFLPNLKLFHAFFKCPFPAPTAAFAIWLSED